MNLDRITVTSGYYGKWVSPHRMAMLSILGVMKSDAHSSTRIYPAFADPPNKLSKEELEYFIKSATSSKYPYLLEWMRDNINDVMLINEVDIENLFSADTFELQMGIRIRVFIETPYHIDDFDNIMKKLKIADKMQEK